MSNDQTMNGLNDQAAVYNAASSRNDADAKPRWYIVHTYSGYENKVLTTLKQKVENMNKQDQFPKIVVPVETIMETERKRVKDASGKYKKDEVGNYIEEEVQKPVEYKIFPSYVFIKMVMSDANQNFVRSVRGCTGFVGLNSMNATEKINGSIVHNAPPALTDEEVLEIGLETEADAAPAKFRFDYKVGDTVRIIGQCPFEDPLCVVDSIDEENRTVTVIGNMFGRKIPAELSASDVEPADL